MSGSSWRQPISRNRATGPTTRWRRTIDLRPTGANSAVPGRGRLLSARSCSAGARGVGPTSGGPASREHSSASRAADRRLEAAPRGEALRQQLVFTLPADGPGRPARSSLGGSSPGVPRAWWVFRGHGSASPFFDAETQRARSRSPCASSWRAGATGHFWLRVPAVRRRTRAAFRRLAAPRVPHTAPEACQGGRPRRDAPELDADKNRRPWHAKMLALPQHKYSALMVGSSNFTRAGMGVANTAR